jgi:hypothetical protein
VLAVVIVIKVGTMAVVAVIAKITMKILTTVQQVVKKRMGVYVLNIRDGYV